MDKEELEKKLADSQVVEKVMMWLSAISVFVLTMYALTATSVYCFVPILFVTMSFVISGWVASRETNKYRDKITKMADE